MHRINPAIIAAAALGLLLIGIVILILTRRGDSDQDRLGDEAVATTAETGPAARCASQATYDRVKTELFRQAAQVRQSDQAAFDRIAAYASVRMADPVLRAHDQELGTIRCGGRLSLDLPPNVAVVGGRRSLSADIDYVLQPAADGSGDVVMLEGVDSIVIPLATLAGTGSAAPPVEELAPGQLDAPPGETTVDQPSPPVDSPAEPDAAQDSTPAPAASARPSFNCRYARTRGEIAVCSDTGLAALDRQMAAQYYRALSAAGPRQRQLLRSTRDEFLRFRDRCTNNGCIAETYRGRMREIRDIMRGTWRPER